MQSKKYFDEVAKEWDKMRESFFSETVREKALYLADVKKGKTAADIGAGTGFITEGLIKKGLKVIAVDQSEKMLKEMRKKFIGFKDIYYSVGDAKKLPILEEKIDYIFANMYLHHADSPLEAIKEMVRILKPKGKLIITDLNKHNFEFLRTEHNDQWLGFKQEDIKKWFLKAKLKNVFIDFVDYCCAKSSCDDEGAKISIFVAFGEKK